MPEGIAHHSRRRPAYAFRRTFPGTKLGLAILIGFLLTVPLFSVWLLVYDRQSQSDHAKAGIAEGWGGPQAMSGPLLVIPYRVDAVEVASEGGQERSRTRQVIRHLVIAPELVDMSSGVRPERRSRSIYEVVVYEAQISGRARFQMPQDLERLGIAAEALDLAGAELRFALSDPRGLGANPRVSVGGRALRLQPGGGSTRSGGRGFFAWLDAGELASRPIVVDFAYRFRGNGSLSLTPRAGETRWRVASSWRHPSFQGAFLPDRRQVGPDGFQAVYRVGNLALGQSLATMADPNEAAPAIPPPGQAQALIPSDQAAAPSPQLAEVSLIQPIDLYSQVDRATKYGFLFIGFTFLAFLLFDLVGGVRVSAIEYLLAGAGLVLFFVLLLAFAEVIGFAPAYLIAAAAISALTTAYSAAVLKSWRRAGFVGVLLAALYAVLYVLLSLEEFSLLIGSLLLFVALAAVMYLTRNLDWVGQGGPEAKAEAQPA